MADDPLIAAFFEEGVELLEDFEAGLLQLEENPTDLDLLNRIFRAAHTLKGNSAMLGFDEIARFTHVLEDLLDHLRKGQCPVTLGVVDGLLSSEDVVRSLLARAQAGGTASPEETQTTERMLVALRALSHGEERIVAPIAAPSPGERTLYEIHFRPPGDLFRRGLDPLQILQDLERLGEVVQLTLLTDALPPLQEMDPERSYFGWRIWLVSEMGRAEIESRFDFAADPSAVTIDALSLELDGPGHGEPRPSAENAPAVAEARRPVPAVAMTETASIRVPVERVDRLINLVGELVITQSMVAEAVSDFSLEKLATLQEAVALMDRHARELHERMMGIRMIPIKTLFARFPRLVRDLTAAIGKMAALETTGEETELDKTVIEKIGDPLTHLLRNAVDHGIETPEARRVAGKPEQGRIALRAYQQGGNIYIEVADDGRGLDPERIHGKARDIGLAGDETLTEDQVLALIFRPGFSTADKVTAVSGRGVGMDVVKQNVEALGGAIAITSKRGAGTTFRIKLPLTLAILDGQLLSVGGESYVLPLVSIVESVRPRRENLNEVFGGGEVVTIRNRVLPMLRLHRIFGAPPKSTDPTQGLVVIVEHDGRQVALLVDELLGQQQVVIKSLETNFDKVRGVAGATILGDGRVTLILDVPGLIALAGSREVAVAA